MSHKQSRAARALLPSIISLANADLPARVPGNGDMVPGEIYSLANDSRFAETFFSEPMTNYAEGWRDPNDIQATLEFFAPKVQVPGRLFEFKKFINAEEFYSEQDDIRAIGGDFKRIEYQGQDATGKTLNKGLTMRDMAVQKIARLLKGRLTITLNKDEESDERTYQKRLEQLNQAQWPVPQPDTPLATPLMQPTQGVTVATSRTRLITRDGTRGL